MSKKCAKCEKTVYPVEELKCLEKIWHKTCFKCQVCNMTLSMKNYKGFDKLPYCGAHVPKAKATVVADTPENKRLAENSKTQSTVKYHAEFEANKGRFTQIADDPETLRIKANTDVISNISYHDVKGQKQDQEKKRSLQGGGENTASVTPEPGFKTPDPPEEKISNNINHDYPKQQQYQSSHQPPPTQPSTASSRSGSAASYNSAHHPTSRSTPPNAGPYHTNYNSNQMRPHMVGHGGPPSNQPPPYANPPQQPYHQPPQYQQQQQQLLLQQQQQLKQQQQLQYAQQQQRQAQMLQQQQQQSRQMSDYGHGQKISGGGHHQAPQQQKAPGQYSQYQQPQNGYGAPPYGHGQQHPGQPQAADPRRSQTSQPQPPSAFQAPSQPPTSRVPQGMRCYQAMYDYESQDADEVSFRDGDIIINAAFIDEGWMTGTVHRTGQSGMLPANYVEPVNL